MQSQEAAFKGAEDLLRAAEKEAPSIESSWQAHQQNGKPAFFNIFDKLRELYVEESTRTLQQPLENLRPCSHLLEKLIQREKLNTLVVNLYPGTKGYSLQIKMQEGDEETQNETVRWPYSNDELLSYIDNEELPPFLADLLDHAQPRLYYSGCIIAEVRDYRQYHPTAQHSQLVLCDIHHVLLKPSNQSILNDVDAIVSSFADEEIEWSLEDKLALEGALILAKTGPLCLDPSPAVGLMRHNLHNSKHVLNTPSLRQRAKKYSQTAINRKRKLDQLTKRPETVDKLADFIASHKRKPSLDRSAKKPKKVSLLS